MNIMHIMYIMHIMHNISIYSVSNLYNVYNVFSDKPIDFSALAVNSVNEASLSGFPNHRRWVPE